MLQSGSQQYDGALGIAGAAGPAEAKLHFELIDRWAEPVDTHGHLDVASVAVGPDDRVWFFTRNEGRVLVYERDGSFVDSWGDGIFTGPHGITIAPDSTVYCADYLDHTVRRFSANGELLLTLGTAGQGSDTGYDGKTPGSVVRTAGPFHGPTACAVGDDGRLYVTDGYGNAAVHVFDPDGELLYSFGEPGSDPGQYRIPHWVTFTPDGLLAIADRENDRIQFVTTDGQVVDIWTHLQRPASVFIAGDGRFYVAELFWRRGSNAFTRGTVTHDLVARVCVTEPDGEVIARWGGFEPCVPGNFAAPHDLAVDSHGDLYVVETGYSSFGVRGLLPLDCHTIQKFRRVDSEHR